VHGVYSPGNVKLDPKILNKAQEYISEKLGDDAPDDGKPVYFVFHGGSGSDVSDIQEAISYGVIKMNIDTDTQWSYWEGIKNFEEKYHDYLQGQIGNPEGPDKPNKKYYDVRNYSACVLFVCRNYFVCGAYLRFCILILFNLVSFQSQPRECMRAAEVNTVNRLEKAFADLKCQNICGLPKVGEPVNTLGPRRGGLPV